MDPPERARLEAIYASIRSIPNDTGPLTKEDYLFIGRFIQVFCVADFEARRVLTAIQDITGSAGVQVRKLPDKTVIEHLVSSARKWPGQREIGEGLLKAATTLEMHHQIRHVFAHWAGRRVKAHDALFFLSTSLNHKPPIGGYHVGPEHLNADSEFRMLETSMVRDELRKLEGHASYLGSLSKYLEDNKAELRKRIRQADSSRPKR